MEKTRIDETLVGWLVRLWIVHGVAPRSFDTDEDMNVDIQLKNCPRRREKRVCGIQS